MSSYIPCSGVFVFSCCKGKNTEFVEAVNFLLQSPSDIAVQAVEDSLFSYYVSDFMHFCLPFFYYPHIGIEEK